MPDRAIISDDEWAVWRGFLDMRRRLDVALERQLQRDADISHAEFSVLATLFEAPERHLRVGELGAQLMWEKSRVSHQVSRMERRGLVERRACDLDARGTWVQLTAEGARVVLGALRPHFTMLREAIFDVLSPAELAAFGAASDRIAGALEPCTGEPDGADDSADDAVDVAAAASVAARAAAVA